MVLEKPNRITVSYSDIQAFQEMQKAGAEVPGKRRLGPGRRGGGRPRAPYSNTVSEPSRLRITRRVPRSVSTAYSASSFSVAE